MPESRDSRQDRALVMLLEALPEQRLELILAELGVEPEKVAEASTRRKDDRRCQICGYGYLRCRAINEKAPPGSEHDWSPPVREPSHA